MQETNFIMELQQMIGNTMTIKYFDTLEYAQKARKIKDPNELAEYQAHQMETALETVVQQIREESKHNFEEFEKKHESNSKDVATKSDITELRSELKKDIGELELKLREVELRLYKEISSVRYDMLKYMISGCVSIVVTLGGMMARGFHWF